MASVANATSFAAQKGIIVGPLRRIGSISARTVGSLEVRWDRALGGAACWEVFQGGERVVNFRSLQGDTIYRAVILQSAA